MSDDLDIRSGGAIAVDTTTLRAVSASFAAFARKLDAILADLMAERARLVGIDPAGAGTRLYAVVRRAEAMTDAAADLADNLVHAAAVYEIVELRAELEAARVIGDPAGIAAAKARLAAARDADLQLNLQAELVMAGWWLSGPFEMARQAGLSPLGVFGASGVGATAVAIGIAGRGRVARNAVLTGSGGPVDVRLVGGSSTTGSAPASLAAVVDRMPRGPAQVRVERYSMHDGSARFAVYVAGTQSPFDPREPWNGKANLKLYGGERSASYEAVLQALEDAGAQPGDAIYQFGHSQGAMITSHLALESGYDTQAIVTFGSPVSADVASDILSVQVRHDDDPVVGFADGGNSARVGADDSIIVERTADPVAGPQDIGLKAHGLDEYRHTAALIDDSSDPRVAVLDDLFDELGSAASVEVFEYAATSPDPFRLAPASVLQPTAKSQY